MDTLDKELISKLSQNGGFSVHTPTGMEPHDGFMVSIGNGRRFGSMRDITPEAINSFVGEHQQFLNQADKFMGGWLDTQTGEVWLDVSQRLPDKTAALTRAKELGELAIFDVKNGDSVYTDKTATLQTEAAPRWSNPADHPWFQANPVSHENIVKTYDEATPEDVAQGDNWYPGAHTVAKLFAKAGNLTHHQVAGLLATYSPNTSWPTNLSNVAAVIDKGEGIGGKGSGYFASASQRENANKILEGTPYTDILKGPKIRDFAHLIEHGGDQDPAETHAVIDRHAMSVAAGRRLTDDELDAAPISTPHYYNHVVQQYKKAADVLSEKYGRTISPHQVQATTWLVQQRKNATADAAHVGALEKGRTTRNRNEYMKWNDYAMERYPEMVIPGWHNASLKSEAIGEILAPSEVDTLRNEGCPICGEDDSFNGSECVVCGYIAPPEQFRDPDTSVAQQNNLRQDQQDKADSTPGADGAPTDKAKVIVQTRKSASLKPLHRPVIRIRSTKENK